MTNLILEYYEPLTYFAYLILFFINFAVIFAYFKCKTENNKKQLVFDSFYIFYGIVFIILERFYSFFCMKTNIDESFHLGIALKYINGDHFWIDIDPSSVGPLNTLLFALVSFFTNEMFKPLLSPILDIKYYLPDFSQFDRIFDNRFDAFR